MEALKLTCSLTSTWRIFRKFDRYRLEFGQRNLLVGPNNAGKSTIIEALRLISIVINRLGNLNPERPPEWVEHGKAVSGFFPSLRGLDFALGQETFHHYSEPPAKISAQLTSGGRIEVYVGPNGEVFATAHTPDGFPITTKREARLLDLRRVGSAAACSAPDLEHVLPFLRPGGHKLFHHGWHRSGRFPADLQLPLAGAILGALVGPARRPV